MQPPPCPQTPAYLGDGQGLLLHNLVQHRASAVAHLVKLVDAADAVVTEHQSAGLQDQLAGLGVLHDVGGQADGARTLARGVLAARHQVMHVLEQLRLAGAGVSAQQDVDLGPEAASARLAEVLPRPAEELQQDALEPEPREVTGPGDGSHTKKRREHFVTLTGGDLTEQFRGSQKRGGGGFLTSRVRR